ncbi:hypothetical protein ACFTAO_13180 [Paenibacillus rhizoplanae]
MYNWIQNYTKLEYLTEEEPYDFRLRGGEPAANSQAGATAAACYNVSAGPIFHCCQRFAVREYVYFDPYAQ